MEHLMERLLQQVHSLQMSLSSYADKRLPIWIGRSQYPETLNRWEATTERQLRLTCPMSFPLSLVLVETFAHNLTTLPRLYTSHSVRRVKKRKKNRICSKKSVNISKAVSCKMTRSFGILLWNLENYFNNRKLSPKRYCRRMMISKELNQTKKKRARNKR